MLRNNKGFTLIEIILSMAILGFIAVTFITMFTSGFLWIYSAGDKEIAHNESKKDIETRLATGETEEPSTINFDFEGTSFDVAGGIIESTQVQKNSISEISAFSPLVSTIELSDDVEQEGYKNGEEIFINEVNPKEPGIFEGSTSINVELLDKTGTKLDDISHTYMDSSSIKFNLPSNLTNADGYYIIRTIIEKSDETKYARAKFFIDQPSIIAAGDDVFVSAKSDYWINREDIGTMPSYTATLKSGDYGRNKYVFGGVNGTLLISENEEDWSVGYIGKSNVITSIKWSSYYQEFIAVDNVGYFYKSDDGEFWDAPVQPFSNVELNDITIDNTGKIVAVGAINIDDGEGNIIQKGVIISSSDGINWSIERDDIEVPLLGITSYYYVAGIPENTYYKYIAVGQEGKTISSSNYDSWTDSEETLASASNDLRSISYSAGEIVIVGKEIILISNDNGNSWTVNNISEDLYSVDSFAGEFVFVGLNREIFNYTKGETINKYDLGLEGIDLYTVVFR
jgi:prepilin-type N-terminal cleavage/methylation domain-containing protein